jgi:deoxyribonuclease II
MNISPLDENRKAVDWFFIYKVPELTAGKNDDAADGFEYAYYDAAIDALKVGDPDRKVDKSPYALNNDKGSLDYTLDSIFNKPDASTGWLLYNDEIPESYKVTDDGNKGHTKGLLAFDTKTNTGLWLLHSWPKYADIKAHQDPSPKFGQTYLCLALDLQSIEKIAAQMAKFQEPQVFDFRQAGLPPTSPLVTLANTRNFANTPGTNVITSKTRGGLDFTVIAKNREWNGDFWNDLVGPELQADINVETWIRGPIAPVSDSDGIHKTYDISYINLGPLGIHYAWPETHDHAKWAITVHSEWICVGDINRMISQRKRGGGTICFQNDLLWKALSRTALILAPPNHTRTQALDMLQKTKKGENHPSKQVTGKAAPAKKKTPAKKKAPAKKKK